MATMSTRGPDPDPPLPGFAALGLDAALLSSLASLGYEEPTPIQREAIPPLVAGRDLIGQAATGTGKATSGPARRSRSTGTS
jgi:ATP-dependent RNA helicase DeaD